jgi:hypothetical protein
MKRQWNLMSVGTRLGIANLFVCSALVASSAAFANDDPPEVKKENNVQVVVTSSNPGDILEKVSKALEENKVSAEKRAKIMAQLQPAIDKAMAFTVTEGGGQDAKVMKVFSTAQITSGESSPKGDAPNDGNVVEIKVDQDGKKTATVLRLNKGQVSGRLISPLTKQDDVYRIGVALEQIVIDDEDSEGSDDSKDDKPDASAKDVKGVVVESTMADSPAEKVGIKKGDVIVSADDKTITVYTDLMEKIQEAGKNEKPLHLSIQRDGETIKLEVKPTKMKSSDLAMETIELSLPTTEGFVLDSSEMLEAFKDADAMRNAPMNPSIFLKTLRGGDDEGLAKEVAELKNEIAELKKLVKELVDKK